MSAPNNAYETLYGIGLLDDLHNYFPAVLYDSGRFRGIQDLLHYIQTNARERFDLFSFGQRSYLANHTEPRPPATAWPGETIFTMNHPSRVMPSNAVPPVTVPPVAPPSLLRPRRTPSPAPAPRREPQIAATIDILQEDLGLENQALGLLNLMNLLTGAPRVIPPSPTVPVNAFMEPVIVRPTEAQIEQGSSRAFPPEDTVCTICQDGIAVNQMARRLTSCSHWFHISCIDQWFARDVHCPTCRHDIRETGDAAAAAVEAQENGE